jgi:hypothetical protein
MPLCFAASAKHLTDLFGEGGHQMLSTMEIMCGWMRCCGSSKLQWCLRSGHLKKSDPPNSGVGLGHQWVLDLVDMGIILHPWIAPASTRTDMGSDASLVLHLLVIWRVSEKNTAIFFTNHLSGPAHLNAHAQVLPCILLLLFVSNFQFIYVKWIGFGFVWTIEFVNYDCNV